MVQQLYALGVGFVILIVTLMIGGAMVAKTENVTLSIAPGSTLITTLATDGGSALTTMTSLLPILALAFVGGLAIAALVGFMGNRTSV